MLAAEFGFAEAYRKASVGYGVVALPAGGDAEGEIAEMRQIIEHVQTSNDGLVSQLAEALGQIQFQDVVRQRVEQVGKALQDLTEHTQMVAGKLTEDGWDGALDSTLESRLDQHIGGYVMNSQRDAHAAVRGGSRQGGADGPAIELF